MSPFRNCWLQSELVGRSRGQCKCPTCGLHDRYAAPAGWRLPIGKKSVLHVSPDQGAHLQPANVSYCGPAETQQPANYAEATLTPETTHPKPKSCDYPRDAWWDLKPSYTAEIFFTSQDQHSFWHWKLFFVCLQARKAVHPVYFSVISTLHSTERIITALPSLPTQWRESNSD